MQKPLIDALHSAPWLRAVARVFEREGAPLYIVGGAVRNPFMNLPLSDVDVCGPALPEDVMRFCENTEVHAHLRAAHFGTVELHIEDPDGKRHMAEYTTFREDSYRCGHKPDAVKFTTDISIDALRRDFSVNALYQRVHPEGLGDVIDPTGGLANMRQGVLHTTTSDPDQVLKDDGLRILRAARFQSELDLMPTGALMQSLTRYAALLKDIATERLGDEIKKILLADLRYPMLERRAPGTASGLATLEQIGAWPLLFDGIPYDTLAVGALSRLHVPDGLSPLACRMALLLRGGTDTQLHQVLRFHHFSIRDMEQAVALVKAFHMLSTDSASPFECIKLGMNALYFARNAFDALRENPAHAQSMIARLLGKPKSLKELNINGHDLMPIFNSMGVSPAHMGKVLSELWRMTVEAQLPNQSSDLKNAAEQMIRALVAM